MATKLSLNADKCRGYANCMIEAPEIWDFDDATDTAVLRLEHPPAELRSKAEASVRGCPARAITIEESSR
ncbi:ferredoxin [Nonomuraea sp. NPDC049400]|uniref:ferredoxin n=1 Tax=Nonomuraea sp. NPDC049400 TaxID=3364352 RepID=UPI0037B00B1C